MAKFIESSVTYAGAGRYKNHPINIDRCNFVEKATVRHKDGNIYHVIGFGGMRYKWHYYESQKSERNKDYNRIINHHSSSLIDKINLNPNEVIHELADAGFLIEIVSDGWANWDFNENGHPIRNTATPIPDGSYTWRGCYQYFNKSGNLAGDDVGTGNWNSCLRRCIERYKELKQKDMILDNGFGTYE